MANRNLKDIIGGAILGFIGLFFFIQSFSYGIGTAARMQAGYFPMALGAFTTFVGISIMAPALKRGSGSKAPFTRIAWRPLIAVLAGLAAFALLVGPFGLIPAVFAAVLLAALGDSGSRPVGIIGLVLFVSVGIWLIFSVGLGVTTPPFRGWR
jgi:hypothetical protein